MRLKLKLNLLILLEMQLIDSSVCAKFRLTNSLSLSL